MICCQFPVGIISTHNLCLERSTALSIDKMIRGDQATFLGSGGFNGDCRCCCGSNWLSSATEIALVWALSKF